MSEIAEYWNEHREFIKKQNNERNAIYEPKLKEIGAIEKSCGVYEYKDWLCYPTKNFAMNKRNYKKRISLDKLLEMEK